MSGQHVPSAARDALAAQRWDEAFELLRRADGRTPLDPHDLEMLGEAAYLLGREEAWVDAWSRAHEAFNERGDFAGATRCAFWVAFGYMHEGEMARAGGWLARGQRLVDEAGVDCVECGYLLLPGAIETVDSDPAASLATFTRCCEIGERFGDRDLCAIARHGQARALIRLGETARGMTLLDEVLLSVMGRELSAIVTGDVYCGAIEACMETFDVQRAQEWTAALSRWCDEQAGLAPYRGQCLVYRSATLQAAGRWAEAVSEASAGRKWLTEPKAHPAGGAAYYQCAELQRLQGRFDEAEDGYERAAQFGHDPQPGLALLRLAQGRAGVAAASVRRALGESGGVLARSRLLPAAVEIYLAAGDGAAARGAADELAGIAGRSGSRYLTAASAHALGAVLAAEGQPGAALSKLREAHAGWRSLQTPYEGARTRAIIGVCCGRLGDDEAAALELGAARRAFEELGAEPDVGRVDAMAAETGPAPEGLSSRELEVLRLVAKGRTNRSIADELIISEKTVARHVSNIFGKIGVSSRSGATAYAYEHKLI